MNHTVKIYFNDDGDKQSKPKWHYVTHHGDSPRTLCTGEAFGEGEGAAIFKDRVTEKGGITCDQCLIIIKHMKKIKL